MTLSTRSPRHHSADTTRSRSTCKAAAARRRLGAADALDRGLAAQAQRPTRPRRARSPRRSASLRRRRARRARDGAAERRARAARPASTTRSSRSGCWSRRRGTARAPPPDLRHHPGRHDARRALRLARPRGRVDAVRRRPARRLLPRHAVLVDRLAPVRGGARPRLHRPPVGHAGLRRLLHAPRPRRRLRRPRASCWPT